MRNSGWINILANGGVVADCLALGWEELAILFARRLYRVFDNYFIFEKDDDFHLRVQHFVYRLIGSWQGWHELKGPSRAFDEPIFNALVARWRTSDLDDLEALLLAACDRHTQQSKHNVAKQKYDLDDVQFWYDPFEVRIVLKMRQILGLENVKLDHPIMNTPLGSLTAPVATYTDDLLEGILSQAKRELPTL